MVQNEIDEIARLQRCGLGYKRISQITGLSQNTGKSYCRRHPLDSDASEDASICHQCGKPVEQTPHRKKKLFCSDACRMMWWNAHPDRVNRQAYHAVTCASCGRTFESYSSANRKFCSRACYAKFRAKEMR